MSAKIRGSLFASLKRYVKGHHPPELYQACLEALPEEQRKLVDGLLQYREYYSLPAYQAFLAAYAEQVSEQQLRDCAAHLAEQDLKGLWLVFARMLSKEFLIKRMSSMWNKLYTAGEISLLHSDETSSSVSVRGCEITPAHRLHIEQYMVVLLDRATQKKHRSESKPLPDGAEFHFRQG